MPIATATRAEEFWQQFAGRARVADGAIGTILCSRGVLIDGCFDDLNIVTPDMLRQIHQEYVKAGAGDLKSDPFGANRMRLAAFGLAEKPRSGARERLVAGATRPLAARSNGKTIGHGDPP